jgi:hypothetical protein
MGEGEETVAGHSWHGARMSGTARSSDTAALSWRGRLGACWCGAGSQGGTSGMPRVARSVGVARRRGAARPRAGSVQARSRPGSREQGDAGRALGRGFQGACLAQGREQGREER